MERLDVEGYKYVDRWLTECKIGLGTYQVRDETVIFNILDAALAVGYRYIDTAQVYKNEKAIGVALKVLLPKHNLKREDVFIASKLSPSNQGAESCKKSVEVSLIHWPGSNRLKPSDMKNKSIRQESWVCLEKLYSEISTQNIWINFISCCLEEGKLRSIGVSNYNISHLKSLLASSSVSPALNQCEYHPHYYQTDLVEFCREHMIHFQAYSSFGSEGSKDIMLNDKEIQAMARKYDTSVTNFLLSWSLSQGISVLPRSRNPDHVKENFDAINLKITVEDIEAVKKKELKKYCWDPESVS